MTNQISISSCSWELGYLYTVPSEDGILHVADVFFTATGVDGTAYLLDTYRIQGFTRDPDGFAHPNRNYQRAANAFAGRITARGSINPARWSILAKRTLAEREAYNLRCEQDERLWAGE